MRHFNRSETRQLLFTVIATSMFNIELVTKSHIWLGIIEDYIASNPMFCIFNQGCDDGGQY